MLPLPSGTKIWLVAGTTDMRNGFNGLTAKVQTAMKDDPMSATSSSSGVSAVARLNCCGPLATGCAC